MKLTTLQKAVIKQLGDKETLRDVLEHGAENGYSGFFYHHETIQFFDDNKKLILELLGEIADDLGETKISLVKSFNCLNNYSEDEIGKVLYGKNDEDIEIKNALSWFTLEEVARQIYDK